MINHQSQLDREPINRHVTEWIEGGLTNAAIVRELSQCFNVEIGETSVRRFRKRHKLTPPSPRTEHAQTTVKENVATCTTEVYDGFTLDDPDAILRKRGLDPSEWDIESATVNEWEGPGSEGPIPFHQAKFHLKRRPEAFVLPARSDGWKAPPIVKPAKEQSSLVVIVGDQQAPFHDPALHEVFCGWLENNKPEQGISLGDKVDFPDISRHRLDPENTAKVNECIQAGYDLFRGYRTSSMDTWWRFMPGNHDERIRNIMVDNCRSLYNVRQADTPEGFGQPVLTLPHLLRLDELGIDYVDPKGPYDMAQINLGKHLAVRHGWIARKGSGASAAATLDHLGYSVIVGHTHRQSIIYHTKHDIEGGTKTLMGAEAGCMCRISGQDERGRKFPNFAVCPDWQQGFSTVQMHPDGTFRLENATFVMQGNKRVLLWRDQRYSENGRED